MEVAKVLTAVYDEDLENGVFRIPEDIQEIDGGAFSYCPNLRKLIVPNSIDWLPDFYDCLLLESIEVSEGNEEYSSLDGVLFDKDKRLLVRFPRNHQTTSYSVPQSVTGICHFAFQGCENIEKISIPNSIKEMGRWVFYGCKKLREINISNRVAKIEKNTFFGCENLERIYIPNSVTEFDSEIFTNCDKLTIYCHKGSAAENTQRKQYSRFLCARKRIVMYIYRSGSSMASHS